MPEAIQFSRAEARFEHADRYDRGTNYNARHLQDVAIESDRANRFVVRFPDSDKAHVVHLAADEGDFLGECTCADFEYRDTVCKHLWAVLADPTTAVFDRSATSRPPRTMADGGAVATSPSNGRAPRHGDDVEQAVADRFALRLVDAPFYDARATSSTPALREGTPIQIKGTQEKIRNGYDENGNQIYTSGRLTIWREELLQLLADAGRYVVATYDDRRDPRRDDFLTRLRVLTPEEIGEVADGSWYDGHRPSKGERAKVSWQKVMGVDPDV